VFENDYTINGRHATYLKYLHEQGIFKRYIDVYMHAAVWGLMYGRLGSRDTSSTDRARIYADAFVNERDNCVFLYRLAMLLDETTSLSPVDRVNRAFRDDAISGNQSKVATNLELFNSYVLGGIELLFEKLAENCSTRDDYIDRIFSRMESFRDELAGISYEERLAKLLNG